MNSMQWRLPIAVMAAGVGLAWGQETGALARRMTSAPSVDGQLDEWASAPRVAMRQPDVPDLKVNAAIGWDDAALYLAVDVTDGAIVNTQALNRIQAADCAELRIAAAAKDAFLRLRIAPASAAGKPACVLSKHAATAGETLLETTEPSTLAGFQWALQRHDKGWRAEAAVPHALSGLQPAQGAQLPFVLVVWDRDRPDVDEWKAGSGWNKRSESSSQKAPVGQWPSLTLADAAAQEAVRLRDGVSISRHRPCNLFTPDQNVVLFFTLKGFPPGDATATGILTDPFGRECGRVETPVRMVANSKEPLRLDLGRPGRGYYELALAVRAKDATGRSVEGAGTATLGVMEQPALSAEDFLKQDRRFGLKWWGGVTDKPETIEMMGKLGLQWTRAIVRESVQIVTNSALLSVVKIERFPRELFDEERYGGLEEWERQFGKGAWTLKTLPRKAEYQTWLAESLRQLPSNQKVFEIWNEPWDKMSPEDFAAISQWIAEIVRKERPGSVLGPNLRGDMSDYGYDAKVVRAGGMNGMDMVCLHPYAASEDRAFLRKYKAWMSALTGREITIYITEYGSHSCPEGPARRSELEQARAVVRQSLALYAEDAKALVPHWVGQSEQNRTYHEDWYGFIRRNQQPKPVLVAHANTARLVDGGHYLGDLWYGPGIGAMAFRKEGRNVLALWTGGDERQVELQTRASHVVVEDQFGHPRPATAEGGKLKLSIGSDVVYVCGLGDEAVAAATPELREDRWPKPAKPARNRRVSRRMPPPVLDGRFDDWKGATELYIQNPKVNGDDASGIGYLAWDDQFLYVGVNMRDNELLNRQPRAKLYRQDSIELFVSTEVREENPGYGPHDYQFFLTPTSGEGTPIVGRLADREAGEVVDVPGAKHHFGKTGNGWTAEVALPWSAFPGFKAANGVRLALELRVNDADTSHERWKLDPLDAGFVFVENPATWSVLTLEP